MAIFVAGQPGFIIFCNPQWLTRYASVNGTALMRPVRALLPLVILVVSPSLTDHRCRRGTLFSFLIGQPAALLPVRCSPLGAVPSSKAADTDHALVIGANAVQVLKNNRAVYAG